MYICNECGFVFDEPKVFYESHGFDSPPFEKWSVCPHCKESSYREIKEETCSRCGAEITDDEAYLDDNLEWLCDSCYEELYNE